METKDHLKALVDAGFSQVEISAETGVKQPIISRILSGKQKEWLYSTARAIEKMYLEKCNDAIRVEPAA